MAHVHPPAGEGSRVAPRLVIRADGGPGIGSGHLARCLALAQAWLDQRGEVTLVSAAPPAFWRARYEKEGVDVQPPGAGPLGAEAQWVALDGYRFGSQAQEEAARGGARLLVIDDHGRARSYRCDVIHDQNLGASDRAYSDRRADTALLLGSRYVLLRREFAGWHQPHRRPRARTSRVLVALGGGATARLRAVVDETLARPALAGLSAFFLDGKEDVPSAMASADIALAAAGSICWELCFMGVPAVLFATADNQVPLAAALEARGAATSAGWHERLEPEALAEQVAAMAGDAGRRGAMAEAARSVVDGRGAARVVTVLRARLLRLRPARASDCRLLWEWANDPAVRAASRTTAAIPWDVHVRWFTARLADPESRIYLAVEGDQPPLGQVRFERISTDAEISVNLSPSRRGEGLGPALVEAGVSQLFGETPAPRVTARIRAANRASIRAFESAGFVAHASTGQGDWLQYHRRRSGGPPIVGGDDG